MTESSIMAASTDKELFVEDLTFRCSLEIFGLLLRLRRGAVVRYVDASVPGLALARLVATARGLALQQMAFSIAEMRDAEGRLLPWRVFYEDLTRFREAVMSDPTFARVSASQVGSLVSAYVAKMAIAETSADVSARRAFILARVAAQTAVLPLLVLRRRPWQAALRKALSPIVADACFVGTIRSGVKDRALALLGTRSVYLRTAEQRWAALRMRFRGMRVAPALSHLDSPTPLAVEYYGQLNLDAPELHSDLVFRQESAALRSSGASIMCRLRQSPVDRAKLEEVRTHSMTAVALDPRADTTGKLPVYYYHHHVRSSNGLGIARGRGAEMSWLRRQEARFAVDSGYWEELLGRCGAKIYVSWFKSSAEHIAITDAARRAGGVTAYYQRSLEDPPYVKNALHADVFFAYSPSQARVERDSGSEIPHFVAVGYIGDHRFSLLADEAHKIRARLEAAGASRIVAFFDENSTEDGRWGFGHGYVREEYAFLLGKVVADERFGLVLKPKVPSTLRRRLGDVVSLLEQALATGRCEMLGAGPMHSPYPPALAALAADVAVGHMFAGTASLEAALAGIPSLLMDPGCWPAVELARLPEGRVVFRSWEDMWAACEEHWDADCETDLGQWGDVLDALDPFRDGLAAKRMGDYLAWLLKGFDSGLSRETALAQATERYARQWGGDKITSVSQGGGSVVFDTSGGQL